MAFLTEIDPKLGDVNQVVLFIKTENQMEAEDLYRGLRQKYKVSRLMVSRRPGFSFCIYITLNKDKADFESFLKSYKQPIEETGGSVRYRITETHRQLDFNNWQRQFIQIVSKLNQDRPNIPAPAQEIPLEWVNQKVLEGETDETEQLLLDRLNQGSHHSLRALIALYSRTSQSDKVIKLYETYRQQILGLPVSGLLVNQLVSAYVNFFESSRITDFLQTARQIATTFLPELERLGQASEVRQTLQKATKPFEPPLSELDVNLPLQEKLVALQTVKPEERLVKLEHIEVELRQNLDVQLVLAQTLVSLGSVNEALGLYEDLAQRSSVPNYLILEPYGKLLLEISHYQEVLDILRNANLTPVITSLMGSAFYWLGDKSNANKYLVRGWAEGVRQNWFLLPLARLWAETDLEKAALPYRILVENYPDDLNFHDYQYIITIADGGGFGELSEGEIVAYFDEYISRANYEAKNTGSFKGILERRVNLHLKTGQKNKILVAYADWLDWLAQTNQYELLQQELGKFKNLPKSLSVSKEENFELLEGLEAYIDSVKGLRQLLINEYFAIALSEVDEAIRQARPETSFFENLIRALLVLNTEAAQDVKTYQEESQRKTRELGLKIGIPIEEEKLDLSGIKLAIVGGHPTVRSRVIEDLENLYHLKMAVEVAPSKESHISRGIVQDKVVDCNLIAVITGYMGHDLSNILRELESGQELKGPILWLSKRGKSGVVRQILEYLKGT